MGADKTAAVDKLADEPYVPTTEQVRRGFAEDPIAEYHDPITNHTRYGEMAFDRWLAAHDAEVARAAAKAALEEAEAAVHGIRCDRDAYPAFAYYRATEDSVLLIRALAATYTTEEPS